MPLTAEEIHHLPHVISAPRFATYLRARGGNREHALRLYQWNLEISAAFMAPLHVCEIAIRNGVSESLEAIHGGAWPSTQGFIRSLPNPQRGHYSPKHDLTQTSQKHPTTGKVVSDLKFAFWESILTKRFDRSIWNHQFLTSFPGGPTALAIPTLRAIYHTDVQQVRLFRNRIAHHEPIFARNLQDEIDRIIRVIEWRNPTASNWLSGLETASQMIGHQP